MGSTLYFMFKGDEKTGLRTIAVAPSDMKFTPPADFTVKLAYPLKTPTEIGELAPKWITDGMLPMLPYKRSI